MSKNKYTAFIPVRAGSKSIKLKNIRPIAGKPLVCWTIEAACNCDAIDEVYISTDGEVIRKCVEEHLRNFSAPGKIRFFDRDPNTATDTASTESAMEDFASKVSFENIILIQATSPLLTAEDLSNGIEIYENEGCDSVLSAVRQKRFHWAKDEAGNYVSTNYDFRRRPRRQEFEGYLVENGAFYITSSKAFKESKCRLSGKIGIAEMDESTYYEIDEPSDWVIIENLLKNNRKSFEEKTRSRPIKLLLTDCDGVLTDGGMYYSEKGDELKKFNTKDGMGIQRLKESGIKCGIITGENTQIVVNRGNKLKLDYVYTNIKDKLSVLKEIAEKERVDLSEIAYIGDDINDVECISAVGLGMAVADAMEEVKECADYVLSSEGGRGAVREAAELILNSGFSL